MIEKNVDGVIMLDAHFNGRDVKGWKPFKVYHTWQKKPSLFCSPFLPYIVIPIKNNESKVVKYIKKIIF